MNTEKTVKSPLKAIRAYCLDCGGDSAQEVRLCPCVDCALFPFRFGKNPFIKRTKTYTEEERHEIGRRLHKAKKNVVNSNE